MTATDDAPEPTTEERWQHIENRLAELAERTRTETDAAITRMNACLERLDALGRRLADPPWGPRPHTDDASRV